MKMNGKTIALTVAGLMLAAAPTVALAGAEKDAKVKCSGANACKGKGGCASAKNECAGKNGCKGQGWNEMSEKECKAKGGTVVADKKDDKKADKK